MLYFAACRIQKLFANKNLLFFVRPIQPLPSSCTARFELEHKPLTPMHAHSLRTQLCHYALRMRCHRISLRLFLFSFLVLRFLVALYSSKLSAYQSIVILSDSWIHSLCNYHMFNRLARRFVPTLIVNFRPGPEYSEAHILISYRKDTTPKSYE